MATRPDKTVPAAGLNVERITMARILQGDALLNFTPRKLVRELDYFARGYIRPPVLLWEKMMERDDQLLTCAPKRKRGTASRPWEIITTEKTREAEKHRQMLSAFYNGLRCVNAFDLNQKGGVRLFLQQMLTAVDLGYAFHEIVWQPTSAGLTAELRFIPLKFFENRTGQLRFLPYDAAWDGLDCDEVFTPTGWMVTAGDGLMRAGSVAYLFKWMPLKAWLAYSEKFGVPGLHATTSSPPGSPEWETLKSALAAFGEDLALITSPDGQINPIELKASGSQPHPELVDRMDRALSRLWLGGDLTTMSKGGASRGALNQSDDLAALQDEDIGLLNDTVNDQLDRRVIAMVFGEGVPPLAWFRLKTVPRLDTDRELRTDQFLISAGVPMSINQLQDRYSRPSPAEGDLLAHAAQLPQVEPGAVPASNEALAGGREALFEERSSRLLSPLERKALAPVLQRILAIDEITEPEARHAAFVRLRADLPTLEKQVLARAPQLAGAFEKIIGAAFVDGFAGAARAKAHLAKTGSLTQETTPNPA